MTDDEIIKGIRSPGRFDADVDSAEEAERLVRIALPKARGLPDATEGLPYPTAPPGTDAWYQRHPAEPAIGNNKPHLKYVDWSRGKKGRGGTLGPHLLPACDS